MGNYHIINTLWSDIRELIQKVNWTSWECRKEGWNCGVITLLYEWTDCLLDRRQIPIIIIKVRQKVISSVIPE